MQTKVFISGYKLELLIVCSTDKTSIEIKAV